ncbi:hypothetical protein [Citrobacter freundii]|uniref:hypothetical protein n=1 Tax=Citrobacter freundii TaxID=546 RepID=UPI001F5BC929|nr:hypothetical protein [Citrobacter freundii]
MMNPVPWLQMTNMISYQGLVRTFPKTMSSFLEHAPFFIIGLSVICAFFVIGMTDHDYTPVLEEHKRNEARLSVYHRLRYVEADNIVFDPQSMKGCYAERKFIASLVESCITK